MKSIELDEVEKPIKPLEQYTINPKILEDLR